MRRAIVHTGRHGVAASSLMAIVVGCVAKHDHLIQFVVLAALLHEILTVLLARQVVRSQAVHHVYGGARWHTLLQRVLLLPVHQMVLNLVRVWRPKITLHHL